MRDCCCFQCGSRFAQASFPQHPRRSTLASVVVHRSLSRSACRPGVANARSAASLRPDRARPQCNRFAEMRSMRSTDPMVSGDAYHAALTRGTRSGNPRSHTPANREAPSTRLTRPVIRDWPLRCPREAHPASLGPLTPARVARTPRIELAMGGSRTPQRRTSLRGSGVDRLWGLQSSPWGLVWIHPTGSGGWPENSPKMGFFGPLRRKVQGEWGGSAHSPDPTAQSASAPQPPATSTAALVARRRGGRRGRRGGAGGVGAVGGGLRPGPAVELLSLCASGGVGRKGQVAVAPV